MIATPAWEPIYSLESVDGKTWQNLIRRFTQVNSKIKWPAVLKKLIEQQVNAIELSQNQLIDGELLSKLTVSIFYEALFSKKLSSQEQTLYYSASLEWRKEIAVKGKGSRKIKNKFYQHLRQRIHDVSSDQKQDQQNEKENISAIAQPFILSPQINFSDILASLFLELKKNKALEIKFIEACHKKDFPTLGFFIFETLRLKHPFPVLEREILKDFIFDNKTFKKGTQVFMLFDMLEHSKQFSLTTWEKGQNNHYKSILFGSGQRQCPGKNIAIFFLCSLVVELVKKFPFEHIKPYENHFYSGRDNDNKDSLAMNFYQIKILLKTLWNSFLVRHKG